jgi:hypothetical protein
MLAGRLARHMSSALQTSLVSNAIESAFRCFHLMLGRFNLGLCSVNLATKLGDIFTNRVPHLIQIERPWPKWRLQAQPAMLGS